MAVYTGATGSRYDLGVQIAAGGEGTVFAIQGSKDKVAKLYKSKPDKKQDQIFRDTQERKLRTMLQMNIPVKVDGVLRLAWPLDILYDQGQMMGFVMPKIPKTLKIFDVQRCKRTEPNNPGTKNTLSVYPGFTWKYSLQIAYNLAWVVKYVHSYGIIIGDFNQNNIYLDIDTSAVVLIDCDSFDITNKQTGERFPCEVGLPEMLAPELQKPNEPLKGKYTMATDNFSLAVHIFRLLMLNEDPFGGIPSASASSSLLTRADKNIINGNCPYVRRCELTVPPQAPDFAMLPLSIQDLFRKTFDYTATTAIMKSTKRATASEWCGALLPLATSIPNANLKTCVKNKYHIYPDHNTTCPWCKCESYKPVPPPPNPLNLVSISSNNVPVVKTQHNNGSGTSTSGQAAASSGGNQIVRRTPYLLYIVLIACGIASGFIFENLASKAVYEMMDAYLEPATCALILAVVGAIGGVLLAHHFEAQYMCADNAIPWLFLGIVSIFIPPIVGIIFGIVVSIVIFVISVIMAVAAVGLAIAIVCACLSGS